MHPALKKNYGNWAWHDRPRPGVLHHVAKSGDEVWTVRAGTPAADGRLHHPQAVRHRRPIRRWPCPLHHAVSNIEFMVTAEAKVEPLIKELEAEGFPVGGTGNSVSMISHTQGWLHCDIPGTDASGVVKA